MIYITGDIHGEVSRVADAVERFQITSEDMIVILGDVGMNYYGNNRGDRHRKKKLNKLGVPVFCIHGNHEMRPSTIDSYHEVQWKDGTVYIEDEYPNLLFAKDGEVYDLDGHKTLVIGGAYSVDKWYRLRMDMNWFPDEQPSDEIKTLVEQKLEDLNWKIDVILSHTCPERYVPVEAFLSGIDQSTVDNSTEEWLSRIEEKLDYKAWYCGHWHINKRIDDIHKKDSYTVSDAKAKNNGDVVIAEVGDSKLTNGILQIFYADLFCNRGGVLIYLGCRCFNVFNNRNDGSFVYGISLHIADKSPAHFGCCLPAVRRIRCTGLGNDICHFVISIHRRIKDTRRSAISIEGKCAAVKNLI